MNWLRSLRLKIIRKDPSFFSRRNILEMNSPSSWSLTFIMPLSRKSLIWFSIVTLWVDLIVGLGFLNWKGINCVNSILHPITSYSMNLSEVIISQLDKKAWFYPHVVGEIEWHCLPLSVLLFGGFGISLCLEVRSFVLSTISREELSWVFSRADILPPVGEKRFRIISWVLPQIISS